jgi:CRISPR system Cascade subunit CasD
MPDYLIFQLYGQMAAWGDIAVGETRRSALQPSKSALLGIVGASLGIDRNEEEIHAAMASAYGIGIKVVSAGTLLVDYHTVQVPPQKRNVVFATRKEELAADKLGTLLSSREYRCDAAYVVALWSEKESAPFALKELCSALRKPKYLLYLGRKSCPISIPCTPEVSKYETLKDALDSRADFEEKFLRFGRQHSQMYCWDETPDSGLHATQVVERWDVPKSRQRWQFSPRTEKLFVSYKEA